MNPTCPEPRRIVPLDAAGWRWAAGRLSPANPAAQAPGEAVSLPHCWNAVDEYVSGRELRRGWATYWLDVELPAPEPEREVRLRCGGFHGVGRAWLNGCAVGRFNADYLGFDLDITEAVRAGINRLAIQVCNRYSRAILPGIRDPDFHLYGGLGGGLHLALLPRVRLVRRDCQATSEEVASGAVRIEVGMMNCDGPCTALSLQIAVRDPAGRTVAEPAPVDVALAPGESARREIRCEIPAPQLWSPDTPVLYEAEAALRCGAETVDRIAWTFGLRTAEFDPQRGFVLNGKPTGLRGVNRHENLPGFGFALPPALHAEDARLIKELGFNFVRLSHYPQSPAFLDACDRLGLLVYAELCSWKSVAGGRWLRAAETQLARMIRRDRHHPAVILWGLGNEGRHRDAYLRLRALARELDPSRPTIYAENHARRARRKKTAGLTDVWGLNYEFEELDFAREAAPTGCVVVSECANLPYARRGHWAAEAQQATLMRGAVRRTEAAGPGAAGWTLWSFADYATPRRQRWFRECGVVDGWRAPKLAADWARARHNPEPFLSVRGDWSLGAGLRRRLYVATNAREVRMIRADGASELLAVPEPGWIEVDVGFDDGPIRFVGAGVETTLEPWGEPAGFSVRTEALAPNLCRCRLQVADERGAPVLGFEGEAVIRLPAGARASLVGGETAPVHAGQATFYVETARAGAEISMECHVVGCGQQSIRLPTGGERP
jgi:beta-galactosidase